MLVYETLRLLSPDGALSISLRSLLPRVIAGGGSNDIAALQQVDWSSIDGETLALAALSTIARANAEIARRPSGDWIIDSLIDALGEIGVAPTLVEANANRVLDCLQRLGRSSSRATTVAVTVARVLRSRGAESTRHSSRAAGRSDQRERRRHVDDQHQRERRGLRLALEACRDRFDLERRLHRLRRSFCVVNVAAYPTSLPQLAGPWLQGAVEQRVEPILEVGDRGVARG